MTDGRQSKTAAMPLTIAACNRRGLGKASALVNNAGSAKHHDINFKETEMWHRAILALSGGAVLLLAAQAHAGFEEDLFALQQRWSEVRYQAPVSARKAQFEALLGAADTLTTKYADRADSWLWAAVIRGSLAEATGNLSALGLAKEARAALEKAIAIDANVEGGYAYDVLGQLYAKVPGWPIGFGNKKKARQYLQKALAISPDDINTNYFYAQFLFDHGEYTDALRYVQRAQAAPSRTRWPLADQGRQREVAELLDKINKKLQ
jgi:tetratricopeptide (TPR) repeat protein